MARYIDEGKLIQAIIKERDNIPLTIPCASYELLDERSNSVGQSQRAGIRKALRCIANAPTADVAEVVRCKDCKHYKPYAKPVEDFDGECIVRECETDENEFCSYGTPKERGGEK